MSTVGYATLQIIPSAKGFGSALNGQVDPAMTASGKRGGAAHGKAFSGAFMPSIAKIGGALGAAYAGTKALGFLKGAVAEASDLNEAGTKLQAVFGTATGDVLKFAQGGAKGLGQSNLAVQNSAALFGVYGRAAGLAGKANAGFSTQLVKLSTDLASFYNTDPAEAAAALASGLRGETEPLRAYGVLLDANSVKAEALKQHLIKSTKDALTPQAKVLATQALILKQTSLAQGDFARTSGGLANQQRILSAQVTNLKGKVGAALLPAMVASAKATNAFLEKVGPLAAELSTRLAPVITRVSGYLHQIGGVIAEKVIPPLSAFFYALTGSGKIDGVGDSLQGVVKAGARFREVLLTMWTTFSTKVLPAFARFAEYVRTTILPAVFQMWQVFATKVLPVLADIATFVYGTLVPRLLAIVVAVATRLKPVFDSLVQTFRTSVLPIVVLLAKKFAEWWPTIKRVISVVVTVTGFLLKLAATILGKVLPPLIRLAGFLLLVAVKIIAKVIGAIVKVIGWVLDFGSALGKVGVAAAHAVGWVKDKFDAMVSFVRGLPGKIASAASGMWNGIKDAFRSALNWIIDKWNGLEFGIPGVNKGPIHFGGIKVGTPNIPRLAEGGLIRHRPGGILANIGEGREDEAVIPLSKLPKPDAPERRGDRRNDAPLVGSLTLQSTGNTHDDLEETLFALRRLRRGGVHA